MKNALLLFTLEAIVCFLLGGLTALILVTELFRGHPEKCIEIYGKTNQEIVK